MNETQRRILNVSSVVAAAKEQLLGKATDRGTVIALETFAYTANVLPGADLTVINAGANGQVSTSIQADSDFLMLYIMAQAITGGAAIAEPYSTVQFTDNTTNRTMFSAPALMSLIAGDGGQPYIMQESKLIYARTQFITTINNLSATNNQYQFVFAGLKVYYKGSPGNA